MNLHGRNLSIGMQGEDVHLLHGELKALGYDISEDEIERRFFGPEIQNAVLDFQRKRGFGPTGVVDESTAHAINTAVEAQRPIPEQFIVNGRVSHQDETPLAGLTVGAFDIGPREGTQLGEETITDAEGRYEVTFTAGQVAELGKRRPDLVVRTFSPEGGLLAQSQVRQSAADEEVIDLVVVPRVELAPEEALQTHTVTLRLVDRTTGAALASYSVRAFGLDAGDEPIELGLDISNARGLCTIIYAFLPATAREEDEVPRDRHLRLLIADPQGAEIHQTEIRVRPDAQDIIDVPVPVPPIPRRESPRLEDLNEELDLRVPKRLLARLRREQIRTVDDVRKAGGISRLDNLPVSADHPALRMLEAHAHLSVLSDDLQTNDTLIRHGFTNGTDIADTPRSELKERISGELEDATLDALHRGAVAQQRLFANTLTRVLADGGYSYQDDFARDALASLESKQPCVCRDCESAVSPLAYLADLLSYTLKNVRVTQNDVATPITIDDLSKRFYQPFADLPVSCDEMDRGVRQIRLCIEVLRRYLSDKNLPAAGSQQAQALASAQKAYRLAAYESLLVELGTSYEELRLASSEIGLAPHAKQKERNALAAKLKALGDKLGIDLALGNAFDATRLKGLVLAADERTEETLERLFGLTSTAVSTRDPLSDGVTLKDNNHQVTRCNLEGVEWNRNTDADGLIHLRLEKTPGAHVYTVDLYRDSAGTKLVAHGERTSAVGQVKLSPANSSGLTGFIEIAYHADATCELSGVPALLSWRLDYLRQLWQQKDWPAKQSAAARPLVDPDLIDASDLRIDRNDNPAYTLWDLRKKGLKALLAKLQGARNQAGSSSDWLDDMLQDAALGVTWPDLSDLEKARKAGKGQSVDKELQKHGLTNAAFVYLMRIRALAVAQAEITSEEWADVDDILIEAKKRKDFYATWMGQEQSKDATPLGPLCLGPDWFRLRTTALTGYPPDKPRTLPKWRATQADRVDWEDDLDARVEQEESLISAFWDAVSDAEEATLPNLRDALVVASDASTDKVTTKAKRIGERLLIDASTDACRETTRISQAIETIQTLLWSRRTGQLADSHPDLTTVDEFLKSFDDEWTWMGSYASWRAAMLVFLYPENVLIPTLRRYQTPAFQQLVANLRKNRDLDPEDACQEAKTYSNYFRDICNLEIEATCHAKTRVTEGKCRDRKQVGYSTVFYMVAQGRYTGALYWSAYDPKSSDKGYEQSFWEAVPVLTNANKVVGVHPYWISDKERYLYLFAQLREGGEEKLVFIRYDLETQTWDSEQTELELPDDVTRFDAVLCQRLDEWTPRLVIHDKVNQKAVTRRLSQDGTDWEDEDFREIGELVFRESGQLGAISSYQGDAWNPFDSSFIPDFPSNITIRAVHQVKPYRIEVLTLNNDNAVFVWRYEYRRYYSSDSGDHQYAWCRTTKSDWQEVDDAPPWIPKSQKPSVQKQSKWGGSFQWEDNIFLVWHFDGRAFYSLVQLDPIKVIVDRQQFFDATRKIGRCSGSVPQEDTRLLAYQKGKVVLAQEAVVYNKTLHRQSKTYQNLSPDVTGPFSLNERVGQTELQKRRGLIKEAFLDCAVDSESILTYLIEAYYLVPMQLALQLQQRGHYISSLDWFRTVYDYSVSDRDLPERRKIFYGLIAEEGTKGGFQRVQDWLRDPLNPHLIAATRPHTYTRFTLLSIVGCLLDYADAEFTRDTGESLALASTLYETALSLLDSKELKQEGDICQELVLDDSYSEESSALVSHVNKLLAQVRDASRYQETSRKLNQILGSDQPWEIRRNEAKECAEVALAYETELTTVRQTLANAKSAVGAGSRILLGDEDIFSAARDLGLAVATSVSPTPEPTFVPAMSLVSLSYSYCISPNPIPRTLRLHAELNLYKLRTCRNIAGMERTLDPYSAATDQTTGLPRIGANGVLTLPSAMAQKPTQYRFSFLVERAKQLVNIAQQMEAAMLTTLEKRDAEMYSRLKASQDLELAGAQVKLQTLRVKEAKDGVDLAELQQKKAQIQVDQYQTWLTDGKTQLEEASLGLMIGVASSYALAAAAAFAALLDPNSRASGIGYTAQAAEATAQVLTQLASYERRAQEWEFNKSLSQQDVLIGKQQVKIAEDQVRIVGQESEIAKLQKDHAKATADFLANKFTNFELYDWMSGILEGVYSYFLQEATGVAKLAENQLAFERQMTPPRYIQDDYWEASSGDMVATTSTSGKSVDRSGLTGSAKLTQDLYQLEQYAIDTEKRKLELSKTISLTAVAPVEFQQFRETGVISFRTPMEIFDRDFPGHYLRMVKRVKTSVIALIPPNQGIHATLSAAATSRAVIGGEIFQEVIIKRNPELVALTSTRDATGLFELQQQSELLLPFEGQGVDTTWEFRMPRASNQFDYDSIADVLLTIDYTALYSYDYYDQVIQTLQPRVSADRAFSFRHELSDQWYDLHHPELIQSPRKPMVVSWKTDASDFPPNLKGLNIDHVVLYFARKQGADIEVPATLQFTPDDGAIAAAPQLTSTDGVISTRRGNAAAWLDMMGLEPLGEWELELPDTKVIKDYFKDGDIENILFVITYSGRTPAWPT